MGRNGAKQVGKAYQNSIMIFSVKKKFSCFAFKESFKGSLKEYLKT